MSQSLPQESYTLCSDQPTLQNALADLTQADRLFFDCEGDNLGEQGGSISLITLRTPTERNFIIDVLSIERVTLQPLLDLLSSPNVQKVVYDGRMDYSALTRELTCTLQNVVDLQLVDVKSRAARGEGQAEQFRRLWPYIPRGEVTAPQNRALYLPVHKLCGLRQCMKEHDVIQDDKSKSESFVLCIAVIILFTTKSLAQRMAQSSTP